MIKSIIYKGQIFNRLEVIEEDFSKTRRYIVCKCKCGLVKSIMLKHLISGKTKSCGCLRYEISKKINIKHNMTGTRIHKIFMGIKGRCNDKTNIYYGGRGIKCLWESFEDFYKDMGSSYKEGLTIERKENNLNYSKSNCVWKTAKEQARNRKTNRLYKGKCIIEWCEELGLNKNKVYLRLSRGWEIERALT